MHTGARPRQYRSFTFGSPRLFLLLVFVLLAIVPLASAQAPDKVDVFISFRGYPGPAEEAIVESAGGNVKYTYNLVSAIAASVPEQALNGLRQNPQVIAIEPDIQAYLLDSELDNSWGVKHIGAGIVHDIGNRGASVRIGILDSGIDLDHPDLAYDPACSASFVEGETLDDGNSHGTHVAGTAAALDNNDGVVGAAPEATLCIYKVFSNAGTSDYSDIVAAIERAVTDGVQITNNSYGSFSDPGSIVKEAFDNAYAAGVLHVAAAGNYGSADGSGENCIFPARWDSVIATANTTQNDLRASSSSTCAEVELAAPGDQIFSSIPGGGFGTKSGTSMAAPHVAGAAALILAANPGWSNEALRAQLQNTADDLGDPGRDPWYGYGLVDVDEAAVPPAAAHVGDLNGLSMSSGKNWLAQAAIEVHDQDHALLPGALVSGAWSGGWSGSGSCTTSADGTCTILSGSMLKKDSDAVIFTVTSVAKAGYTYEPLDNHDPQGNSSGSQIQINRDGSTSDPGVSPNQPPSASFIYSCAALSCSFDASGASDADGTLTAYDWSFGDGSSASGVTASHTFSSPGLYTVSLSVTDDAGAVSDASQDVSVSDGAAGISLTASGYKVKGLQQVDLTWSGAGSSAVDIYRDGLKIAVTANDGAYIDPVGAKGGGSYQYQVCEAGSLTDCSNFAQVDF